ncbi:Soluble NSF attachment protein 29 [Trichinella zimbabwensis]|uniref:Phosphomevalonate kinase n=1 Tax=Trichinella zimbabwensis TaxID=268475 RepID=A0A0V1HUF0_9BILA|nr:Soluble NSF attachment protein 29 [Trichinella zimbabwensis]
MEQLVSDLQHLKTNNEDDDHKTSFNCSDDQLQQYFACLEQNAEHLPEIPDEMLKADSLKEDIISCLQRYNFSKMQSTEIIPQFNNSYVELNNSTSTNSNPFEVYTKNYTNTTNLLIFHCMKNEFYNTSLLENSSFSHLQNFINKLTKASRLIESWKLAYHIADILQNNNFTAEGNNTDGLYQCLRMTFSENFLNPFQRLIIMKKITNELYNLTESCSAMDVSKKNHHRRLPVAVVLVSGKRKSGKDFISLLLKEEIMRRSGGRVAVFLVHISNPLKQEYAKLKGLDYEHLSGSSNRKELYRKEMVKWGEAVRNQDPEYFCRQAVEDVEERSQDVTDGVMWIICDCRRPTDLAYFKRYYGSLSDCFLCKLRIEASESIRKQRGWTFCPGVDDAETECALDAGVEWDFIIENNEENDVISRIEQLATRVLNATAPIITANGESSNSKEKNNFLGYTKEEPVNFDDVNYYEQQIEAALQNSLASTGRSLKALQESEDIGFATAQDLIVQGEKLHKVDKKLGDIQSTTKQTQRHLNSVKSLFGNIRNYFNKDKPLPKASEEEPVEKSVRNGTNLQSTVQRIKDDSTGIFSDNAGTIGNNEYKPTLADSTRQMIEGTRWGSMNQEIEGNLGLMENNLLRLKELGIALGEEVQQQNELIDRVARKADKTNMVVDDQNRQMRRILGNDKKKTSLLPSTGSATASSVVGRIPKLP